ncbi:hypothetical protein KK083_13460 [Fulvivirgaceae bacterium PWU4]|uniref:Uncharacterized protein n=1 Tax=Chryseosolibacter histidini TaxID=2782349 RepID=A0AAP2DLW6_9BACT|nr:hypothetical protein [Chryseosolibacter histidini]MBT1697894.1 hypothetical protein [Chryseosolibacter histidini]
MASNESGHAINVAKFEELIGLCTSYGPTYNPVKGSLKLTALTAQLAEANTALQALKAAKTAHDNATNAREIAFKDLKPLATRIVNALAATDAARQTLDDAKTVNNKIQGRRAVSLKKPAAGEDASAAEAPKTASVSQQGFDNTINHFAQLIQTLTAEPAYKPNEDALKVATLTAMLEDMRAKNSAVILAATALSNARIARDKVLYAQGTGLYDVAQGTKNYVKSLFGATSPQFKQFGSLRFTVKRD